MSPEEVALVARLHAEDREAWEKQVEAEHDPTVRGREVVVVGGRKVAHGTVGTTFWSGRSNFDPSKTVVGVLVRDGADETKVFIDSRWLRVIEGNEAPEAEYLTSDEEALEIIHAECPEVGACAVLNAPPPEHLPNPYGYGPHPSDCPACIEALANGTPFTLTPRSETYWSA